MESYLDLMRHVRDHGVAKADRPRTGTRSVFGYQMRFDLAQGFGHCLLSGACARARVAIECQFPSPGGRTA